MKAGNKNALISRLKTYSSCASALIGINQTAKAGVVYTDVDPDVNIGINQEYNLDLNNDNVIDFRLTITTTTTSDFYGQPAVANVGYFECLNSNQAVVKTYSFMGSQMYLAKVHNSGDVVNANMQWYSSVYLGAEILVNGNPVADLGGWVGSSDKFVALKLKAGANTYFGWVRLDVNSLCSKITIKDYAYNDVSGGSINCGDGMSGSGIKNSLALENISIYGFQNKVYVNFLKEKNPYGTITIFNALGQTVYTNSIAEAQSTITMDEPVGNFFMISVQTEKGTLVKKVFLKN